MSPTTWTRIAVAGVVLFFLFNVVACSFGMPGSDWLVRPLLSIPWMLPGLAVAAASVTVVAVNRRFPSDWARTVLALLIWLVAAGCAGCTGMGTSKLFSFGGPDGAELTVDGRLWIELGVEVGDMMTGSALYDCGRLGVLCSKCAVKSQYLEGPEAYRIEAGHLTVHGQDHDQASACGR
jgi:hypothetical protein